MFPNSDFQSILDKYVEARLHNDKGNQASEVIKGLQDKLVGHRALPVYVVMDPNDKDKVLAKYQLPAFGDIRAGLLEFLEDQTQHWDRLYTETPSSP